MLVAYAHFVSLSSSLLSDFVSWLSGDGHTQDAAVATRHIGHEWSTLLTPLYYLAEIPLPVVAVFVTVVDFESRYATC